MNIAGIIADLDAEIARLQSARDALKGVPETRNRRRGRRKMSAAARARISAAQKARWAKVKKPAK